MSLDLILKETRSLLAQTSAAIVVCVTAGDLLELVIVHVVAAIVKVQVLVLVKTPEQLVEYDLQKSERTSVLGVVVQKNKWRKNGVEIGEPEREQIQIARYALGTH